MTDQEFSNNVGWMVTFSPGNLMVNWLHVQKKL